MTREDGLAIVDLGALGWGAVIGGGIGLAALLYLLTAQPGGWTELVKALTVCISFSLGAVPCGWVVAWIVGLPHPWLVAVGGAVWFLVAYGIADAFFPERIAPWVHCVLCLLGYALVAGLTQGGDSASGSSLVAIVRVVGGIFVLSTVTGLVGWALARPFERLVVTHDLRRVGLPLLVPRIPDHELSAGSVGLLPPGLSLYFSTQGEYSEADSKVAVRLARLAAPFPPTDGPWVAVHGTDYWTPDGDDRWIHHTDQPTYVPNRDGDRPRLVRTEMAVRRGTTLVVFTNDDRTVPQQALHAAAESLQPMDAKTLAGLVDSWL